MCKLFINFYFYLGTILLIPYYVSSQDLPVESDELEIGIIEQLDSYLPDDIKLISEDGDTVFTGELFGKPIVLNLVYFRCPGICTPLMDGLASVVQKSGLKIDEDYKIVTVSFNPREGTKLAKQKKENYLKVTGLEEAKEGWIFYTSDSANISRLTQSVGFRYKKLGNDFLHTGTLIFIADDGKITRYLNGVRFLPFEFKMAIIETSKGQSGPTINKVLQYCYSFDPEGHEYTLNITRVTGIIITFFLLVLFLSLIIKSVSKKRKT